VTGNRAKVVFAVLVAALAFLVSAPSLRYGFVFDENILIKDNPVVHSLGNVGEMFGRKFWPGPARGIYYRPLITLSYAAGYALAGNAPWVQHLINVLGHAAASVLAFFLLARITERDDTAGVAAMLFALHPIHAESVAWAPGRTDVIAVMFMLGAWLALLEARETDSAGKRAGLRLACALLYAAALFSKEIAVVLPALVLALDFSRKGREARQYRPEYLGLLLLTAAFMGWRFHVLSGPGPDPAPDALAGSALGPKVLAISMIFALALGLNFFPCPWRIDYAYSEIILSAPAWAGILCAAAVLAVLLIMILSWKRLPLLSFAIAGFFITMLPVSQLVPFPTLFAERFLYLPSLFACLAAALGIVWLLERADSGKLKKTGPVFPTRPAATLFLMILLGCLALVSILRIRVFRNELSFWQTAAQEVPDLAAARNGLGIAYRNRGLWPQAEEQYQKAIELDPTFTVARMNLAEILLKRGETAEGVKILEQAATSDPANPVIKINLGLAYMMAGETERAKDQWEAALALDPQSFAAHAQLARYYLDRHDLERARSHLAAAQKLDPMNPLIIELTREMAGPSP
jgi:Flp pilus assembly protein TadD